MTEREVELETQRYLRFCPPDPVTEAGLSQAQRALGITFPHFVRVVGSVYAGGMLGGISHNVLDPTLTGDNVLSRTLELRQTVGLPTQFVVIAEPPASLILLDTATEGVIWLDDVDVARLVRGETLFSPPHVFPDYGEFFRFLLDREEAERS